MLRSRLRCGLPIFCVSLLLGLNSGTVPLHAATQPIRLTFEELTRLSQDDPPSPELAAKLNTLLSTPIVVNNRPLSTTAPKMLRITEWNIERGENLGGIEQALTKPDAFLTQAQAETKPSAADLARLRTQLKELRQSDVVILNEVDIGVKRTGYRNVAEDMARLLHMNLAYAVEFVEVDSLLDLGLEKPVLDTPEQTALMTEDLKPDPERFRGLHVNAILSRYPLTDVHIIRLPVCHDWYKDERQEISQLEQAKRKAADVAFMERISREVRRGNRNGIEATIHIPDAAQPLTLVNIHLENKCKASCRDKQMQTALDFIRSTKGPVLMAGDLNTTGSDGTPTSVRYELMRRVSDYQFWANTLLMVSPVGLPFYISTPGNFWKNFRDPTARHIPVVARNNEAATFNSIKKFRFNDGGRFDWRGVKPRNLQRSSKSLSDSNERATKGFVPTFALNRDFGSFLRYRLDWIFAKPAGTAAPHGNQTFYPQMPITMNVLNTAEKEPLSDHAPIQIELPIVQP